MEIDELVFFGTISKPFSFRGQLIVYSDFDIIKSKTIFIKIEDSYIPFKLKSSTPYKNKLFKFSLFNIDNEKKTLIADLEIGYKDLVYTYRSNVLLNNQELTIKVDFIHGPFKNLDNSWIFKKIDDQSSEIEFFIDFELNVGVLNLLISKFFDKAFKKMVDSFENRANQIYGTK